MYASECVRAHTDVHTGVRTDVHAQEVAAAVAGCGWLSECDAAQTWHLDLQAPPTLATG